MDKVGNRKTKITSFTQLDAWQSAHALRLRIYTLAKAFPAEGRFVLANQIRRSASSVSYNLAEGFSRRTSKGKAHFYTMAQGSLTETQDQLILARDLKYINELHFQELAEKSIVTHKLIAGLIKSVNSRKL